MAKQDDKPLFGADIRRALAELAAKEAERAKTTTTTGGKSATKEG